MPLLSSVRTIESRDINQLQSMQFLGNEETIKEDIEAKHSFYSILFLYKMNYKPIDIFLIKIGNVFV